MAGEGERQDHRKRRIHARRNRQEGSGDWRGYELTPFSFFDHTGDIGVRLSGRTLDDLFAAAAAAFTATVTDAERVQARQSVRFSLESTALDLLVVDFLNEILYRFETQQFLVATASVEVSRRDSGGERSDALPANTIPAWNAAVALHGEPFDAARHGIKVLIKAVTYHALEVREDPDGWHATVIFDI